MATLKSTTANPAIAPMMTDSTRKNCSSRNDKSADPVSIRCKDDQYFRRTGLVPLLGRFPTGFIYWFPQR
jgi:hypothetical protein